MPKESKKTPIKFNVEEDCSRHMQVLIIEDDEVLADGLKSSLEHAGFAFQHIAHGVQADEALRERHYDAVILDLTLPGLDGTEVLRRLRERKDNTPVLVLTARSTIEDRVFGLDIGADDYVTKPFDLRELEARLRALVRRSENGRSYYSPDEDKISIDPAKRTATHAGKIVTLSVREMELLEIFLGRKNDMVTREEILSRIQKNNAEFTENVVEVYVHRLRKKLSNLGVELKTVRGLGYMLISRDECSG